MTMTKETEIGQADQQEKKESTSLIVSNQGLTATATATTTTDARHSPDQSSRRTASPKSSSSSQSLDFIGTSHAVKNLFSIPYNSSDKPLCFAVHNLDGTLLIDDTILLEEEENENETNMDERTTEKSKQNSLALSPSIEKFSHKETTKSQIEALSMLTNIIQQVKQQEENFGLNRNPNNNNHHHHQKPTAIHNFNTSPVREYIEWKFQDLDLLVGSDALILRPEDNKAQSTVAIRLEEVSRLQRLWEQVVQNDTTPSKEQNHQHQQKFLLKSKIQRSYAQALLQKPDQEENQADELSSSQRFSTTNLENVKLQTCIVPSSDPLGGLIDGSKSIKSPSTDDPSSLTSSPKCIVLDAYLDNIMANVPQLALCLQEKGVLRSVKLLKTDDIPSMMLHPSTLDVTNPFDSVASPEGTDDLFSPNIMEANASALLRFLKANCTRNNSTYLLRREPGDEPNNIQLYDISSISSQRQRKWVWWLATMSYRFALRLRHLEWTLKDLSPMKKRAFRDRQRSLYQTTLDLLQDLLDMEGSAHESLVASVQEHMADTFLGESKEESASTQSANRRHSISRRSRSTSPPLKPQSPPPVMSSSPTLSSPPPNHIQKSSSPMQDPVGQASQYQPYTTISVDGLNKAQDHLVCGIKALWPVLKEYLEPKPTPDDITRRRKRGRAGSPPRVETSLEDSEGEEEPPAAMVLQLFGMYYKAVNVSLRLAEHHLRNYYSSSAMQELRNAGRRMKTLSSLLKYMAGQEEWSQRLQLQYVWLWEHCGHFSRSFASDDLWRDRGHACGDDVISLLRDVDAAFSFESYGKYFGNSSVEPLAEKTKGIVNLQSLSAVVHPLGMNKVAAGHAMEAAREILGNQLILVRDKRQVLVASCISYSRAILAFQDMNDQHTLDSGIKMDPVLLNQLYKRLGDACNECGKVLLAALRSLLVKKGAPVEKTKSAAKALLASAIFWFEYGLESFQKCNDLRNLALLRCNLCQCYKLKANSSFVADASISSHAEDCLQEAANHLQAAHESMGQRDVDPMTWDMVSEELAATFLVLAVRRRQSLLGGGNSPVIFQALRLSPGKERSVVEPMEKALKIYEQLGNMHQAAAVHYQLALTNAKIWTCQRDETKTREKLSAAFQHYNMAFQYFSASLKGNEATFVLLCLDMSSLYAAVAGEEGLTKALLRCLDTRDAFSQATVDTACNNNKSQEASFLEKMEVLAENVEDRVFKVLKSLVKIDSDKYKDIYREGLTAKIMKKVPGKNEIEVNPKVCKLLALHDILVAIKTKFDDGQQ